MHDVFYLSLQVEMGAAVHGHMASSECVSSLGAGEQALPTAWKLVVCSGARDPHVSARQVR